MNIPHEVYGELPKGLYLHAAEETGASFHSMIGTFKVLKPSDAVQIEKIANRFAKYTITNNEQIKKKD